MSCSILSLSNMVKVNSCHSFCHQINISNAFSRLSSSYVSVLKKTNVKYNNNINKSPGWKNTFLFPRVLPISSHKRTISTNSTLKKCATFPPGGSLNNDIDRIVEQLKSESSNVLVMAGAGLSTPSGIPDFRSPESGIYDNLQKYKLPYPEAIFDIEYFRVHPEPFNTWSKEYLPGVNYKPSIGHYFVRLLQDKGKLLRHFTQNIDGLELLAGVEEEKIVAAHGSFSSASCIYCKKPADLEGVKKTILDDGIPYCKGN